MEDFFFLVSVVFYNTFFKLNNTNERERKKICSNQRFSLTSKVGPKFCPKFKSASEG